MTSFKERARESTRELIDDLSTTDHYAYYSIVSRPLTARREQPQLDEATYLLHPAYSLGLKVVGIVILVAFLFVVAIYYGIINP